MVEVESGYTTGVPEVAGVGYDFEATVGVDVKVEEHEQTFVQTQGYSEQD